MWSSRKEMMKQAGPVEEKEMEAEAEVPDLRKLQIGQQERARGDKLHTTPAHSAFRHPSHSFRGYGHIDTDSDSEDEIPLGVVRTPPHKSPAQTQSYNVENTPPSSNRREYHTSDSDMTSTKYSLCDEMDTSVQEPSAFNSYAEFASHYIPPDLIMRHARATMLANRERRSSDVGASSPKRRDDGPNGNTSVVRLRERDELILQDKEKEERYQRELSALRSEQRRRQASQQKEFEDGHKYSLQCEQFQLQIVTMGNKLAQDTSNLENLRLDIQNLRAKMEEDYIDHVGENIKISLADKISAAEERLGTRQSEIDKVFEFVQGHREQWLDVDALSTRLSSDIIRELRAGGNAQVLLLDRIASTLEKMYALCAREALDKDSMNFLQKHKIGNCMSYLESCKNPSFGDIVALNPRLEISALKELISKITPTLSSGSFGNLKTVVDKKVSDVEDQIRFVEGIFSDISNANDLDDVCFSLRESLEGESAQNLRSEGSSDIDFLDRVLHGLEQIRVKQPISDVDSDVIKFLTENNEKLVPATNSTDTGKEVSTTIAAATSMDVKLLGPDLNEHVSAIQAEISAVSAEHQNIYKECLDRCLALNTKLQNIESLEKENNTMDRRNERRNLISQTTTFLLKRLDETSGPVKKHLLSHIFQLIIGMAATKELVTILEISIIPSTLCLGNIERCRIFHDVVKVGAPICFPRLDITSSLFDRRQRVRIVGLFAAQIAYSVELNETIGMSDAGLEKTLQTVWHWLVSCGNALSHMSKSNEGDMESFCEVCDSVKLFLDIAGATLLNFLGPRLLQFLVGPLEQILHSRPETEAKRLIKLLDRAKTSTLASIADMCFLSPMSCFARVKKCEWDYTSQEWKTLSLSHKKELTEVKKIVGRAFNQLGTDASGLRMFQESMGKLKTVQAMQNPDLRRKVLFYLSDKALSTCRDFKRDVTGNNAEAVVAPLATAFMWLLGSQKGMAEVFFSGLCSYCPFAYQMSMAVSDDDAVNNLELGYLDVASDSGDARDPKKWRSQMEILLSFYATLIVRGHEAQIGSGNAGGGLSHFTARDAWMWISRTVNFLTRNKENSLPNHTIWVLFEFIKVTSPVLEATEYRDHFFHLLGFIRDDILPNVRNPVLTDMGPLDKFIAKRIGG